MNAAGGSWLSTGLKRPELLPVQSLSDDRGVLVPFTDCVDDRLFRRCYFVENYGRGVVRGLHYHERETKIFTIVSGAAKFVTAKLDSKVARRGRAELAEHLRKHPECGGRPAAHHRVSWKTRSARFISGRRAG